MNDRQPNCFKISVYIVESMLSGAAQPARAVQEDKDKVIEGEPQDTEHSFTQPQDERQDSVDEFGANWDPLQGGYQAITDICEEARSRCGDWDGQRQDIYEPARAVNTNQVKALATMPLPQRFCRRERPI